MTVQQSPGDTADDPIETPARRQYGPLPAPLIAWSGGRAALALVLPVGVGLLLAGTVTIVGVVVGGHVVVANGTFTEVEPFGVSVVAFLGGLVVAALGFGFGVTAATAVVIATADDAVLRPGRAWRWALGRRRLVAGAASSAVLAVLLVTAVARAWHADEPVLVTVTVGLSVVGFVVAAPLLLGWVSLVAGVPRAEALRRAWGAGRSVVRGGLEVTATPRRALVGVSALVLGVGVGIWLLLRLMPASVLRSSSILAWWCVIGTVVVLMVVAVAARGAAVRGERGRLRPPVLSPETADRRPGRTGVAAFGVLLVPVLAFAGVVSSNPAGLVQYTVASVDEGSLEQADVADVTGRTVVSSIDHGPPTVVRACRAASCGTAFAVSRPSLGSAIGAAGDGGLLTAHWTVRSSGDTARRYELDVVHSRPDQLEPEPGPRASWWPTGRRAKSMPVETAAADELPAGRRTTVAAIDVADLDQSSYGVTAVAIAARGDWPVVVGIARGGERDARSHLFTVFCGEPSCVRHTVREEALAWIPPFDDHALDAAVMSDGTAAAVLRSRTDPRLPELSPLRLVSSHPDRGRTTVRDVASALPPGESTEWYRDDTDARVAAGSDGNPVVLARSSGTAAYRMTFCADAPCSSSTHRDVAAQATADVPTAFVIDRSGRPLLAVRDDRRGTVGLVSCRDDRCVEHDQTTIARSARPGTIQEGGGALAMRLTADGLPMLAVAAVPAERDSREETQGFVIRCDRARCGAP